MIHASSRQPLASAPAYAASVSNGAATSKPAASSGSATSEGATAPDGSGGHGLTFRELLSDLNPLQYLPVVGTIYRAVTGDKISEPLREAGSLVVSGLLGGPFGVMANIGTFILEKVIGVDPDTIGQKLLAGLGIGGPAEGAAPALSASAARSSAPASTVMGAAQVPWSHAQLAAYASAAAPVVSASAARPSSPATGIGAIPESVPWSPAQLAAYGIAAAPVGDTTGGE